MVRFDVRVVRAGLSRAIRFIGIPEDEDLEGTGRDRGGKDDQGWVLLCAGPQRILDTKRTGSHDSGPDPLLAIELIAKLNLYPHIFVIPTPKPSSNLSEFFPAPHPVSDALLGGQILTSILSGALRAHVHPALFAKLNERRLHHIWLAVALLPYRGGVLKEKKKDVTMAEVAIRDGIKVSRRSP